MSNVEWKVLKSNADAERAQLNKILADIRSSLYSGGNGVGGLGTTNNTTVTRNFEDRLNALAMAWRDTSSRVLYYDNTIESIAQDITYLNARIDDIEIGGGDSEAIQLLTARVIATEEGIIANSEFITELNAAVFDPDTGEVTWAGALEELTVTVNGIEGTVLSMYSLELDANGYVVGWKFANDGSTGVVDFRADRFRITAPGSMKSVEFADGMLMSETGTHSYYHGVDFGTANNLITWFGPTPTLGPAGANPDNGVFWIKSDGSGYFGGGLSSSVVEQLPIIQEIIVDITDLYGEVESVVNQLNSLQTTVYDPVTGLSTRASIQELNQVKSRLDNTGGGLSIESVATAVNSLNTAVNDPTSGLSSKASNTRVAAAESRLNNTGGGLSIESVASNLSSLTSTVFDASTGLSSKASNSTVTSLSTTVSQQGNTLLAHGRDISSLSAEVGGYSASISELREVSAGILAPVVLNSGFENGNTGWSEASPWSTGWPSGIGTTTNAAGVYSGLRGLVIDRNIALYNRKLNPVRYGQRFKVSARVRSAAAVNSGASVRVYVRYYRDTEYITHSGATHVFSGASGWVLTEGYSDAPTTATHYTVLIWTQGMTQGNICVDDVLVEDISSDLQNALAKYTLSVSAGGDVTGMELLAGGGTSSIRFLSEHVGFYSSDGAFEIANGRTIARSGGYMTVQGKPFGVGNEFIEWYGPNQTNLNNCSRANALSYKTNNGVTFSRGGFIGGNRVTSGFNPSLAPNATYNTGAFGTGGAPISVNASYAYSRIMSTNSLNGRFTPGTGTTQAHIRLYRAIGTAPGVMVASQTISGNMRILTVGDASDTVFWDISGNINYIDTDPSLANRTFEVALITRTLQNANHNGQGVIQMRSEEQSLGIITVE